MIPVYKTIIDSIIAKIASGEYQEGAKLPSESQLTAEFNTSRITVTRALKELELTGVIFREKGRGSFVAPQSSSSSRVISLIIPHKTDFFSGGQQYLRSVYKYCQQKGYLCSVHYSEQSSRKERAILDDIIRHQVAGVILYPIDNRNVDLISRMMIKKYPLVLLDRPLDEVDLPVVESENYQGALQAVDYLLDNGHRKIAFIGAKDAHSVTERYRGYCRALIQRGVPIAKDRIFTHYHRSENTDAQEVLDAEDADTIMAKLLATKPRVSAVFCVNDLVAYRMMQAAKVRGLRIPDDLSIVGFDNMRYLIDDSIDLTSVEQNFDEIGRACIDLLSRQIDSRHSEAENVIVPTKLKIGKSVTVIDSPV